ncbi:hypothetical protein GCM10010302_25500 [Streptomyces polychromogenes]|uniref:Uncharacterized protein n=1 Tax=Streptomyces polychromogenes TaxID=67342 RepID=A0ABN0VBX7_9ACTN
MIQLMVELVRPEPGQSVYGRDGAGLGLFGQELNVETCSIARLNLLQHNVTDGSVLCGDTLAVYGEGDEAPGTDAIRLDSRPGEEG